MWRLLRAIFVLINFILFYFSSISQSTFFKSYGGNLNDYAEGIISTKDSGFVAVGATESFGNGLTDFYLIKIDKDGNFQWHKTFGGPGIDFGKAVIQTPDSGYLACGYSNSINLNYDLFIIKVDQNGNLEWSKRYGGDDWDFGNNIVASKVNSNHFFIIGQTFSYGNLNGNGLILKINSNGDSLKMNTFGGNLEDDFKDAVQDNNGNLYCIGTNNSKFQDSRLWISKINNYGDSIWNYYSDSLMSNGRSITIINEKLVFCGSRNPIQVGNVIPKSFYLVGAIDSNKNELFFADFNYVSESVESCVDVIRKQNSNNYYLISNIHHNNQNKIYNSEMTNQYVVPGQSSLNGNNEDIVKGLDTLLSNDGFVAVGTTQETNYGFTDIFIAKTYNVEWDSTYSNNLLLNNIDQNVKTIRIYPNPTKRFLHLENVTNESHISIYNLFGRIVATFISEKVIDLENLKKGIYWIEIKNKNTDFSTKFIKL